MSVITFIPVSILYKQILAPIAITLFGLSTFFFLVYLVGNLKQVNYEYFKSIMVGISGGLAVWISTTINLNLIHQDLLLGLNEIMSKIVISLGIIIVGYLFYRKGEVKNESK